MLRQNGQGKGSRSTASRGGPGRRARRGGKRDGQCPAQPVAVRRHQHVPLHLRPADPGALDPGRLVGDAVGQDRRRDLDADGPLLGQALPDQLRHRGGHRHHPRVPVRHELGRVLAATWATSSARRWPSRRPWPSSSSRSFIGLWIFGWDKVSPRVHALSIWLVAFATNLSALWILLANGWMQHPVGYVIRNGRAEMTDFLAVVDQPDRLARVAPHAGRLGYMLAAFFVMGISAWHLLRKNETPFFTRSFRSAAGFAAARRAGAFRLGRLHARSRWPRTQPYKLAAMEAQWETVQRRPVQPLLDTRSGQRTQQDGGRHPEAAVAPRLSRPQCRGEGTEGAPPGRPAPGHPRPSSPSG